MSAGSRSSGSIKVSKYSALQKAKYINKNYKTTVSIRSQGNVEHRQAKLTGKKASFEEPEDVEKLNQKIQNINKIIRMSFGGSNKGQIHKN